MSSIYKNNQSCDVCGKSPARKTEGQGQWESIYLCKNHKKDNSGNITCNGIHKLDKM